MNNRAKTLAAIIAALACSGALAQQATPSANANQQPAAAPQPNQQGVVYPGRAIVNSPSGQLPGAGAQAQVQPQAGQPGAVMGQVPSLPALPGGAAQAQQQLQPPALRTSTPAQLYVEDNMPADLPGAIELYKRRFDQSQRAAAKFVGDAPKPVGRTVSLNQAPGEEAPTARLSTGVPTNIVFTDATGAPWPIEFATPGDPTIVDVMVPVEGSATLQIRPKTPYMGGPYGAVSINLKGNPVPVTLILASAQHQVDTRVDIRIARRGPNAHAPVIDRPGFTIVDDVLMSVLDGVPPSNASEIRTSSSDVSAWSYKGRLYVRTRMPMISPAYSETAASVDGTRVYVTPAVPFVTVSADGVLQNVRIGD